MVERECLERALRGGFARSFKGRVEAPSLSELVEQLREAITRRLRETIQTGARARHLAIGQAAVSEAMREGELALLLLAADATASTAGKYASNAERKGIPAREDIEGATLGAWLGKEFVSVLGVKDARRAARVAQDLKHLRALGEFEG